MHQVRRYSPGKRRIGLPPAGGVKRQSVPRKAETLGSGVRPAAGDELLRRNASGTGLPAAEVREGSGRPSSAVALLLHARRCLEFSCASAGAASGFLEQIAEIKRLVAAACALSHEVALATALLQANGRYSIRHSVDVAVACQVVGSAIGLAEADLTSIVSAALTMNISMLELQDAVHVQRERLDDRQRRLIRAHPIRSEALLRKLGVADELWLKAVLWHHDALDGSASEHFGEDTRTAHFAAELIALADVYCARISTRVDRRASGSSAVLKTFFLEEASKVTSGLASRFIRAVGIFPPGTPVRLQNGEIAVVTGRGAKPGSPHVYAILDPAGMPRLMPLRRDSDNPHFSVKEVLQWSTVGTPPSMEVLWGRVAAGG